MRPTRFSEWEGGLFTPAWLCWNLSLNQRFPRQISIYHQGPVVRTPVSANPGLNFNPGFFFFLSKALFRIIFSILFWVSNHQIIAKRIKLNLLFRLSYPCSNFALNLGYLDLASNNLARKLRYARETNWQPTLNPLIRCISTFTFMLSCIKVWENDWSAPSSLYRSIICLLMQSKLLLWLQ